MRRDEDPNQRTRWLLALCAAFGLAFMFAAANGCGAPIVVDDDGVYDEEVTGGELPAYDEDRYVNDDRYVDENGVAIDEDRRIDEDRYSVDEDRDVDENLLTDEDRDVDE